MALLRQENDRLQEDLRAAKKKALDQGRPPCPGPCHDHYSVPRAPDFGGGPGPGPTGTWNRDRPLEFVNVKPVLMKTLKPFEGKHNDIERFLRDCTQYFKTFRLHYQGMHSLMVGFAISHLEGDVEDWWIHLCDDYWYIPIDPGLHGTPEEDADYEAGPRYQYPTWDEFTEMF